MARIEEKIAEIADPALRQAIDEEVKALKKNKQFGLVFETHSPEVVPMPRVPVKRDATVAKKAGKLTEVWQVVRLQGDTAELVRDGVDGKPVHDTASVDSLLVVRRMAEPIFPALQPVDSVHNGPSGAPHHILIEADNYHALQLLTYAYAGKVDCIYIDPPYNTGARDWKYNNDYVDSADQWRHSKWLTFMEKRLTLCMRLLKSTGILVITIDDYEFHHLRCLLESPQFGNTVDLGVACIRNNPGGRATQNGMAVNHEYAIFIGRTSDASIGRLPRTAEQLSRYGCNDEDGPFEWVNFRKHGADSERADRPKQFYPIYVTGSSIRVPKMDWNEKTKSWEKIDAPRKSEVPVWPIGQRGEEKAWSWGSERVSSDLLQLEARATKKKGIQIYVKSRVSQDEGRLPGTWWDSTSYSSNESGTKVLQKIFDASNPFDFPKSLYAVKDCLRAASIDRNKTALIVDFFAGSGTTLNAVNLFNATDGGQRQCILVTNNELSEARAQDLSAQGLRPGDPAWDAAGICNTVTWPRNKFTILGKRDDGTVLDGEYQTGRAVSKEKARNIRQLGFAEGRTLTLPQRKQLAALMPSLPQSKLVAGAPWFLDEDLPVSVLWDVQQAEAWLEELSEADHLTDIYVVTTENKLFTALAKTIKETLGSLTVEEDEKRPMADGFPANLDYFKLEFLEPSAVALGRQFEGILPILWMMAGSSGPCPQTPENGYAHLHWLIPEANPFAVLMRETRFREFQTKLTARPDLTHIFLVTNSDKAFHDMKADLPDHLTVTQLYKSYLDNFKINTNQV